MANETFAPGPQLAADFSLGANWSGGTVPGPGTLAVVAQTTALVDPAATIASEILLQGGTLSGNQSEVSLGTVSDVAAIGTTALYGDGAIVNRGVIAAAGDAHLQVVVQAGEAIAASAGLTEPSFENAGRIGVAGGGTLAVDGTEFSNVGDILLNGGTLLVAGGGVDGGQIFDPPGGYIALRDGGFAEFGDAVSGQTILFEGSGAGAVLFDDPADVKRVAIAGFAAGDEILAPSAAGAEDLLRELHFGELPAGEFLAVVPAQGGVAIELEACPPCFARGTGILTPAGYVPVERIKPNDPVVTAAGDIRPVCWVGSRTIDLAAHRRPASVRPVRIMATAFGPGQPARPLLLSPDHAVFCSGVLIPVKLLVNGATVVVDETCQAVTYYHLELHRHDILLAENLAVESYLDTGNRNMFAHGAGAPQASPVFGRGAQWDDAAFAPLCLAGPALRAARQSLRERAGELGFFTRTLTDISLWVDGVKHLPESGTVIRPIFRVPPWHGGIAAIRSARFVPAAFAGDAGEGDDYRQLGVAVSRIVLGQKTVAIGDVARAGFHPRAAGDAADWTDGNGIIAVPRRVSRIGLGIAALPLCWVRS